MKIAILSKADASGGGASRVAEELAGLLNANGHIAHQYVALRQPDNIAVRSLYGNFTWGRLLRRLHHWVKRTGFPELIPWELLPLYFQQIQNYDLLHFHDLSSAISPLTVRYLARKIPTVWTFHDCSPFTGGCLQPLDCTRYYNRCGNCPQLGYWPLDTKFDFTGFLQDIKRQTAQEGRFVPVVPSTWMAQAAMHSGMFSISPPVIPHGLDTVCFRPLDRYTIRKKLKLPPERYIVLLVSAYLHDRLKGINFAIDALNHIKSEINPFLLLVGRITPEIETLFEHFDYHQTGYIANEPSKAEYFATADVFLSASLAESFSLVTLETMSTATPAVSFASGGITDLIEHNRTGYLAPVGDVAGLVKGLKLVLADNLAAEWGRNARQRVEQFYSHEIFLQNHLTLYEQVIRDFSSQ